MTVDSASRPGGVGTAGMVGSAIFVCTRRFLFAVLARRKIATIGWALHVFVGIDGPKLTDVGDRVDYLVVQTFPTFFPHYLSDVNRLDGIVVLVQPEGGAWGVPQIDGLHRIDELQLVGRQARFLQGPVQPEGSRVHPLRIIRGIFLIPGLERLDEFHVLRPLEGGRVRMRGQNAQGFIPHVFQHVFISHDVGAYDWDLRFQ